MNCARGPSAPGGGCPLGLAAFPASRSQTISSKPGQPWAAEVFSAKESRTARSMKSLTASAPKRRRAPRAMRIAYSRFAPAAVAAWASFPGKEAM